MADSDQWRIYAGNTGSNAGYLEIATADDASEPIYVRQYTGVFGSLIRTAKLLDESGNTIFPGYLGAYNFSGTSSGTNTGDQNLSGLVPYTGATGDVNLGTNGMTSTRLTVIKNGSSVNGLAFEQAAGLGLGGAGYTTVGPVATDGFGFFFGGATKAFYFSATSITAQRSYSLPDASGTIALTSNLSSSYVPYTGATANVDLGSTRTMTASAFYESSDIRFKNVIEINPNVNVLGIDVIKFIRIDDESNAIRYGYSAQQVKSIIPESVTGEDKLSVNYMDVHTLKIAALEKRILELEAKISNL